MKRIRPIFIFIQSQMFPIVKKNIYALCLSMTPVREIAAHKVTDNTGITRIQFQLTMEIISEVM